MLSAASILHPFAEGHALKRIAIFCDGTWNAPDAAFRTNVWHLYDAVLQGPHDGAETVARYFPGIGTGRKGDWLADKIDQYGGGAFGWGLLGKIEKAYRWLAETYRPGDAIYIFGFSRGAYTARSLGGLIRSAGIPDAANRHRIGEAITRYRTRTERDTDPTHPRSDEQAAFRWSFSPETMTGSEEVEWRKRTGRPLGVKIDIAYLGIWDTVGALGVPGVLGAIAKPFNARYLFHDTELSSLVAAGRHALATDEARPFYPPTLWTNIDELNRGKPARPYRQEWFPGDHGIVGGSGAERGVSNYALDWIAEGARDAGLGFDAGKLDGFRAARRFGGALSNGRRRLLRKARTAAPEDQDVADCTLHRLAFGGEDGSRYDPGTLWPLRPRFAGRLPAERQTAFT
jgi:uncharacterized protein (DUF2235 family)